MGKHFTLYRTILWGIIIFAVCYGSLLLIKAYREAFPPRYIVSPHIIVPSLKIEVNRLKSDTFYIYAE